MAKVVQAAGAVVWRLAGERLEVLLIHRPSYDDWSWPKGKPRKKEMLAACAIREVEEETGLQVVLGVPLPRVTYRLRSGKHKINWYWAAQVAQRGAGTRARPEVEPAPLTEVDDAVWVDAARALKMLTRRSDRKPLKALLDLHADGKLDTWAVLLTRHGAAKKRSAWDGDETTRPLTSSGEKQARLLAPFFAAFGARRILSSPWARCAITVAPYAGAAKLPVETFDTLTEVGVNDDPDGVKKLSLDTLAAAETSIICTHRPVLPAVLAAVRTRSLSQLQESFPDSDPYLRTAEVFVLHIAARPSKQPRVIATETHRAGKRSGYST